MILYYYECWTMASKRVQNKMDLLSSTALPLQVQTLVKRISHLKYLAHLLQRKQLPRAGTGKKLKTRSCYGLRPKMSVQENLRISFQNQRKPRRDQFAYQALKKKARRKACWAAEDWGAVSQSVYDNNIPFQLFLFIKMLHTLNSVFEQNIKIDKSKAYLKNINLLIPQSKSLSAQCKLGLIYLTAVIQILRLYQMSKENKEVASKLIKITVLSLAFMAVEFIGGYLAHSIAIWSDAFHLLSDVLAYIISLIAVLLSEKKSPGFLTFGWVKSQTLGALLNVAFIYIVTIELFIQATHRMIKKDKVEQPKYMLITSIFGLICNFIILNILHSDPNGGHHGCSHNHHGDHLHSQEHEQQNHHHHGKSCTGNHIPLAQISKTSSDGTEAPIKKSCSHGHSHQHHNHEHAHNHQHHSNSHQKQHHHEKGHSCSSHKKTEKISHQQDCGQQIVPCSGHRIPKQPLPMEDGLLGGHQSQQESKGHHHQKKRNINLQAAYIHIITDIILSIGVIIAAVIIYFLAPQNDEWSPWHLADPLCTYLFSVLAIYSTWPILKESLIILLDGCDNPQLLQEVNKELSKIGEVKQILDLKMWSLNRGKYYATIRVRMQKEVGSWRVRRVFSLRGIECFVDVEQQQSSLKE